MYIQVPFFLPTVPGPEPRNNICLQPRIMSYVMSILAVLKPCFHIPKNRDTYREWSRLVDNDHEAIDDCPRRFGFPRPGRFLVEADF